MPVDDVRVPHAFFVPMSAVLRPREACDAWTWESSRYEAIWYWETPDATSTSRMRVSDGTSSERTIPM